MTGRVVHFEIPFQDGDRARAFYSDAFGWKVMPMPDMGYTMVSTGPTSEEGPPTEPGFINGGMFERDDTLNHPMITIDVEDMDAALAQIEKLGGSTVQPKQAVMDMGFAAYFKDPEGNLVGLWQNA